MRNKLILLVSLSVGLSTLATASPAELNLFPQQSSAKIDSFTSYELTVENTGPVRDVYEFSSDIPREITIAPQEVTLEPGRESTVNIFYDPQVDREAGTYTYNIGVESRATGIEYSQTLRASVITEHEVSVEPVNADRTVCLGETADFRVRVENGGLTDETFRLSADTSLQPDFTPSRDIEVGDGEERVVQLSFSSQTPTREEIELTTASTTSYAEDTTSLGLNVETCYSSELSTSQESYSTAARTTAQIPVELTNTGTKRDSFELSSSTGTLEQTELEIDAGETETVSLQSTPDSPGTQAATITAEGRSTAQTSIDIQATNGMNSEVSLPESPQMCENTTEEFEVEVENTGQASEEFSLSTSLGELDQSSAQLDAGETERIDLEVDSGQTGTGTESLQVISTASSFNGPASSTSTDLAVENCNDVALSVTPEVASAGENRSTVYRVDVENPGTQESTYQLYEDGPEWVSIQPREITVAPGDTETVYMYAGAPFGEQGTISIQATAEGDNVRAQETVRLAIDEEIRDAVRNDSGGGPLGDFSAQLPSIDAVDGTSNAAKVIGSVVVGLGVTAYMLVS
jgi:uncharacterized membrane protein